MSRLSRAELFRVTRASSPKRKRPPAAWTPLEPSMTVSPGVVEVVLPLRLVAATNTRGHWSVHARRVKAERAAVDQVLRAVRPLPSLPIVVTMTRVAPGQLDEGDNLPSACKGVRDSVAAAYGMNDRDPRIEWRYAQERGGVRVYGVRITIRGAT